MAKSTKTPAPRKPVKARGALPTPKSSPHRGHRRWYRRQGWQLIAIVVVIAVLGTAWAAGGAWLKSRSENKTNSNAVARFDRRYSVLRSPVVDVLSAMQTKTNEFASGTPAAPDFKKETDNWLAELRKMESELRERTVPPRLPELEEARAVLVQGYLVYIDAVKSYALAADASDPEIKDRALKQGNNLAIHAGGIVSTGERLLNRLKTRLGLEEPSRTNTGAAESAEQPIQLPPEEAPPASSGQPQAGAAIEGAGAVPGMPADPGQNAGAPGADAPGAVPPPAP